MNCGKPMMVICPSCGTLNPPEANYCIQCGTSLKKPVVKKQESVSPDIPKEYVQKLEAARTINSMQGERRIVTILFCDVKGSTSMAEQLDPEVWADIMNRAFDYLIAPIYKYEGTLARLMGDAVLAFFGAPIAHEDDPQRAILAGLDMIKDIKPFRKEINQTYNLDFNIRIGINTGLVVVGGVGSDLFMEYTALGDAINIASRMEQTAKPGTIQVWEDTQKLVSQFFEFELVDGIEVKGKSKPGCIYRVLSAKEEQDNIHPVQGINIPLVGRVEELNIFNQAVSAVKKGRGQIVCVIGEAGLGKTRLIGEVEAAWETYAQDLPPFGKLAARWNQSSAVSYESSRPYGLIRRLIRKFIGSSSSDTPNQVRVKLTETLTDNGIDVPIEDLEMFEILLGIKEEGNNSDQLAGEELKRAIYSDLKNFLELLVQQGPTVLAVDDLHWSDPASVEFIIHLFQIADRLPILFICSFRPDRRSPAWKVKQIAETDFAHRYSEINLAPLLREDSSKLIDHILPGIEMPHDVRSMILKKSDGNPFFLDEIIRALIDNQQVVQDPTSGNWYVALDVEEIAIPDNLQSLLAARIDQLEENAKQVLQMASVIGRFFYLQVLEIINNVTDELDSEINQLQRRGLISENSREPYLEYVFRQALTQETAYNTILLKQRSEFHKKVGEAFLQLYQDRIDEFGSVVGYHFHQAQDPRALQYFKKEGDAALHLYANQEAITFYSKAIEAANWTPELDLNELEYLYTKRGRGYELISQFSEALANYRDLENIGKQNQAPWLEMSALISQAQIYSVPSNAFDMESGFEKIEMAQDIAEKINDQKALAKIYWILTNLNRFHQGMETAQIYGEKAIALARELELEEQLAYSLNDTAHTYAMNGQVERTREVSVEAAELWRKLGNKPMLADSLGGLAAVSVYSGNWDEAYEYSEEAYQISLSIDNLWGQAYSRYIIGFVDFERGDIEKAIKVFQTTIQNSRAANFMAGDLIASTFLSIVFMEIGNLPAALQTIDDASNNSAGNSVISTAFFVGGRFYTYARAGLVEEAEDTVRNIDFDENDLYFIAEYYFELGECYLHLLQNKYEAVAKQASEFYERLNNTGIRFISSELLSIIGIAKLNLGKDQEAMNSFIRAHQVAEELGSKRFLWQTNYYLGLIAHRQGKLDEASEYFRQSKEIVLEIAENFENEEWKDMFLSRKEIQHLLEVLVELDK